MIPRRFYWIVDFAILTLSFFVAHTLAPLLQRWLVENGLITASWVAALSPQVEYVFQPLREQFWILVVASLPVIYFMEVAGRYGMWAQQSVYRIVLSGPTASLIGLALVALVPTTLRNPEIRLSRLLLYSFLFMAAAGLSGYRLAVLVYYNRKRAQGYYAKNVLLVGQASMVEWLFSYFAENVSPREYKVIGRLVVPENGNGAPHDPAGNGHADAHRRELNVLGGVEDLGQLLIRTHIDEVIAVQPPSGGEWVPQVIEDCDSLGILLRVVPEPLLARENVRLKTLFPFQALHLPAVVLAPPHWDSDALFLKRVIDLVLSGLLLILLSPLFLLIAAAIKASTPRAKVFYRWKVIGRNGIEFTGYKFSTMVEDADELKPALMDQNEMDGPVFKMKEDPRVTPLGRFLRKFSLNELPQLWSVFKGDMSLVGPRPAFRHELDRYEFWHKRKLSIKPGITCLWQVRGRNRISRFDQWVEMDLEYIDNWSLWLDLKIMLRTVWVVVAGTGS